jgi:hypothetical protein
MDKIATNTTILCSPQRHPPIAQLTAALIDDFPSVVLGENQQGNQSRDAR